MNMYSYKKHRGFNIIELLVVGSILGIFASVVLFSVSNARAKARDNIRLQDLSKVAESLEYYAFDHGRYPAVNSGLGNDYSSLVDVLVPTYLGALPADPVTGMSIPGQDNDDKYQYVSFGNGVDNNVNTGYILLTQLEGKSDYPFCYIAGGDYIEKYGGNAWPNGDYGVSVMPDMNCKDLY